VRLRRSVGATVVALVSVVTAAGPSSAVVAARARRSTQDAGWVLRATDMASVTAPAFVGNGYLAARIPAAGTGFATAPVETQSQVAGFYAHPAGAYERRAGLPTWSTLAFSDGVSTFGAPPGPPADEGAGATTKYRQTLDLHRGVLTTALTWISAGGRATDLRVDVVADRARMHVAAVRLRLTPHWDGVAFVTDALDNRSAQLTTPSTRTTDPKAREIAETVTADGTGLTAALVSRVGIDGARASARPTDGGPSGSVALRYELPVRAGHTVTVTKYVGIATSLDSARATATSTLTTARRAARQAAGARWSKLRHEHDAAWAALWRADVTVPGDDALTVQARAAMFFLLESTRAGVPWSLSPGGLSSDGYQGHVFWDAETWMYPALLATHPDVAAGVDEYRSERLDAARRYATTSGWSGARIPWESALTGTEQAPPPWGTNEQHITADVALAQWQYYAATGDRAWLRARGWPVIRAAADFWASRATRAVDGSYVIDHVMPPDEFHLEVDNSAYTNAAAASALRIAVRAAHLVGARPDERWTTVADGLKIPFDPATGVHPEFDGYAGDTIKQADVVMLQYPWQVAMPARVAQADLDYYAARTDPNGPSMTDAIHAIDTAALGSAGCASYTFLRRSLDPFVRAPYDQFAETRRGGAFTFTTGIGGFLQEFLYGFSGFRWDPTAVVLDPVLPPQMPGVNLTGLHWHGRTFDLSIGPRRTTVTVRSGKPMPVRVAGRRARTVRRGTPLVVGTRRPDLDPTSDLARCRSVDATASAPGSPAVAAVDGSPVTAWEPGAPGASLTVDLGGVRTIARVDVRSGAATTTPFTVQVSLDGRSWQPVGAAGVSAGPEASVDVAGVAARWIRYDAAPGAVADVAALVVTGR
jgi:trehalose/maltose hydrolase-like predicted phosphorylase